MSRTELENRAYDIITCNMEAVTEYSIEGIKKLIQAADNETLINFVEDNE